MQKPFFFILLLSAFGSAAQPAVPVLSKNARVSLFTVAPGKALYSTFGHNAIRIFDPALQLDRCYDYGTFDFDQPNFYLNFCLGKLLYTLDTGPTRYFEYANVRNMRAMREQVLALDSVQRQRVFDLLETNALPENRYYKYDFFYDNCATRIRDILKEVFYHQIPLDSSYVRPGVSMRQLLRPYLKDKPWTQFGIDLVLGLPTDRKARAEDYMFLPDYVHDAVSKTVPYNGKSLVASERNLPEYSFPQPEFKADFFSRPLWFMCFVALLGLLSMADSRTERVFDTLFWFVLGVAGLIIAFLWFVTDHGATKTNLNLLWAWPTHLLFFWRRTRTGFVETYFTAAAVIAALTLLFWKWMPQEMPPAAIPIAGLVVVKGLWRQFWKKTKGE
jgi:Domain of unknown function (DUF4105)